MAFFALSRHEPLALLSATDLASEHDRLLEENGQLRRAVASHAVIDQAIGAVVVLGQIPPEEAWRALRDVSQRTNTKLRTVAEHILGYALGGTLPEPERFELADAITRYRRCATRGQAPGASQRRPAQGMGPTAAVRASATVPGPTAARLRPGQAAGTAARAEACHLSVAAPAWAE